jgi:hypothetical protein
LPSRTHLASTLLALTLSLGLAGCGPATPEPSATPVAPSPVLPVSTPTPDMDALYAEAERVVWRWAELEDSYLLDEQNEEYPPQFYDILEEPFLNHSVGIYEEVQALGLRGVPGTIVELDMKPAPEAQQYGSEVALWLCQDSTDAPLVNESGAVVSPGGIAVIRLYFKHFDGVLKLFYADSYEVLEACPFE